MSPQQEAFIDTVVMIKESPMNTVRCSEALRMSLGLTLTDNRVSILFIEDGLYGLLANRPELIQRPKVEEYFTYCRQLGVPLLADSEGLRVRSLRNLRPGVTTIPREELLKRIADAAVVIPF